MNLCVGDCAGGSSKNHGKVGAVTVTCMKWGMITGPRSTSQMGWAAMVGCTETPWGGPSSEHNAILRGHGLRPGKVGAMTVTCMKWGMMAGPQEYFGDGLGCYGGLQMVMSIGD